MKCDMQHWCENPITHISEKGYVYCSEHAVMRRRYVGEYCRKMRVWELKLVFAGKQVPSYHYQGKPKDGAK